LCRSIVGGLLTGRQLVQKGVEFGIPLFTPDDLFRFEPGTFEGFGHPNHFG
jgi:hypothetical protein